MSVDELLFRKIENKIKSSHHLYKLYLKSTGKWGAYYPDKSHDIFLTGYKRSGNTFAVNLIKESIPDIKVSSHIHTIGAIKYSIKIKLNTVVNFRKPVDTIISSVIREREFNEYLNIVNHTKKEENDWIQYYLFCLSNHKKLYFTNFEKFIISPKKIVKLCSKVTGLKSIDKIDDKANEVYNSMIINDRRRGGMKNLRSEEKKIIIDQYRNEIINILNLNKLDKIYEELIELDSLS